MTSLLALVLRTHRIVRIDPADGTVTTVTDEAGPSPDGIVLDGDRMYWTTMGAPIIDPDIPGEKGRDYSPRDGGVHSARLDGTDHVEVVPRGTLTTGKQIASDGAGTLYWADREGCKITRVRVDGTGLEDLIVHVRGDDWLQECVGVAVDPAHGALFWTQKGPAKGGQGAIFRAGLEIPPGEAPDNRSDIEVLWDGLPEPIDLEIVGDTLYWTDRGADDAGGNTVNRAPIPGPGQAGQPPEILAGGFTEAIGLAVDEEAGVVYVSALGGDIVVVPLPDHPTATRERRTLVSFGEPLSGLTLER
ncbi:MAG: hypothetical protein QM662_05130 [Gordonia sp. (in: high G+C Gram-positive bacteria)]